MRIHSIRPSVRSTVLTPIVFLLCSSVSWRPCRTRDAVPGRRPEHLPARGSEVEEDVQGQWTHLPGKEVQQGEQYFLGYWCDMNQSSLYA